MTAFFAIARAQLAGRAGSLAFALAFGLVPLVAARVSPEVAVFGPSLVVAMWAVSQVVALLAGVALFGGARLSFFFARPAPSAVIWAAPLAATVAHALALQALMLAPMLLLWPRASNLLAYSLPPTQLAAVTALLVAGGAVTGLVGRARGLWLAADGVLAITVGAAVLAGVQWVEAKTLLTYRIEGLFVHLPGRSPMRAQLVGLRDLFFARIDLVSWIVVAVALAAFVAAVAAGVARGRGAPRRAHAAASLALWSIALPATAAILIYLRWFLGPV